MAERTNAWPSLRVDDWTPTRDTLATQAYSGGLVAITVSVIEPNRKA